MSSLRPFKTYGIAHLSLLLAVLTQTARGIDTPSALGELERLTAHLHEVRRAIHFQDEPRIFVIQRNVDELKQSISQQGLRHLKTINLYQRLLARFRFSDQFFQFIRTKRTQRAIRDLLALMLEIRRSVGIDEEPPSRTLDSHLRQLQTSLTLMERLEEIPATLKESLIEIRRRLVQMTGEAGLGDRPDALIRARELYLQIKRLYPSLLDNGVTRHAQVPVMEIIGINEFIGSFVQAPRDRP